MNVFHHCRRMSGKIPNVCASLLLICGLSVAPPLSASGDHHHGHDHDDHPEHAEEPAKGPHGGRLLERDGFSLEITIFEAGTPPEFRVYAYDGRKPVNPAEVELKIELHRLGGDRDLFRFTPVGDYLRGEGIVKEPHSFDVRVQAGYSGKNHEWEFESHDGRTSIAEKAASESGVRTEIAGPARIRRTVTLYGTVRADEERVLRLFAPYSGHVREVRVSVGDRVKRGDLLAVLQNKETLASYTLQSPRDGLIISRHANPGEIIDDDAEIFVLADLSQVWIDFAAFPRQYGRLEVGQTVSVHGQGHDHIDQARVRYIAPIGSSASQSVLVRAVLDNREKHWLPGLLVTGDVVTDDSEVALAVKTSALQTFRDFTVVFARFNETYEVRMLELGRRDDEYAEVLGGLKPGTEYVTANSYLIKADILKSGAGHDH